MGSDWLKSRLRTDLTYSANLSGQPWQGHGSSYGDPDSTLATLQNWWAGLEPTSSQVDQLKFFSNDVIKYNLKNNKK